MEKRKEAYRSEMSQFKKQQNYKEAKKIKLVLTVESVTTAAVTVGKALGL